MTTWRIRVAYWIPKAINTHSEHVTLIAFPLQQWLHERASLLRHTHIGCLVALLLYVACVIVIRYPDDCHGSSETCCKRITVCD